MNVEEARRALLRRDEDVTWMRLVQTFHRERGEVLRMIQRRQQEAQRAHDAELLDAEAAFNEARARQRREFEEAAAAQRAEERQNETTDRKRARSDRERKDAKKQAAAKKKEAAVRAEEEQRQRAVQDQERAEREERRRTNDKFHDQMVAYNRDHARTPHPKADTSFSAGRLRPTAKTPNDMSTAANTGTRRSRKIATQTDVEAAEMHAKMAERQLIELRRLENLVAQRRREEEQRQAAEAERQRIEALERRRAEEEERKRFEEQRQHVSTIMAIERDKRQRLTQRVLVPIPKSATSVDGGDSQPAGYRTASPSAVATSEALKSSHQLEQDAEDRRRELDAQRVAERKQHDRLLALKNTANLEHQRKQREQERRQRDEAYKRDLEQAKQAREAEEAEAKRLVEIVKEEQRRQEEAVAVKRAEKKKQAQVQALEMKLESLKLADAVQARSLAGFKERMEEANRLTENRKTARQLAAQQRRQQEKRHDAVVAENLRVREEARRLVDAQKRDAIQDAHRRHHLEARDRERFRSKVGVEKKEEQHSHAAFYQREAAAKQKKPRVPVQPEASAQVRMPPHPELAAFEIEAASQMRSVDDEIAAVDRRMGGLAKSRV